MHPVNLDLLHTRSAYQPDGQAKDPHAYHQRDLAVARRAARYLRLRQVLARLLALGGLTLSSSLLAAILRRDDTVGRGAALTPPRP